jgi:UDP-N-acetyl-D-galactosamine dehydrogenase
MLASGTRRPVLGGDINQACIDQLHAGWDHKVEVMPALLAEPTQLAFTGDATALRGCAFFTITVSISIHRTNRLDVCPLVRAGNTVDGALTPEAIVTKESTGFSGCTEEMCIPTLKLQSALSCSEGSCVCSARDGSTLVSRCACGLRK